MKSGFLNELGLTDERLKLARLGASSPVALYSLRLAAVEAFDNLVGKERSGEIADRLWQLLTPSEQQRMATSSPPRRFPLGARLGKPPSELPEPPYNIRERDRVYNELQTLRKLSSPSAEQAQRISDLERELNTILESK